LAGTDFINPSQMKAYTDMVGLVAFLLNQKKKGGEAHVHAEVERQSEVPGYKLLPEDRFPEVQYTSTC
jgi:hypothetical protein